jgi:hypothetical protein
VSTRLPSLAANHEAFGLNLSTTSIAFSVETIGNDLDLLLEYLAKGKNLRDVSLKDGAGDPNGGDGSIAYVLTLLLGVDVASWGAFQPQAD